MQEETVQSLERLKEQVLGSLAGIAGQLADDDQITVDALLAIVRTTGKAELLNKVYDKCVKMPDSPEKADMLIELIGEIETQLAASRSTDDDQEEGTREESSSSDNNENVTLS